MFATSENVWKPSSLSLPWYTLPTPAILVRSSPFFSALGAGAAFSSTSAATSSSDAGSAAASAITSATSSLVASSTSPPLASAYIALPSMIASAISLQKS